MHPVALMAKPNDAQFVRQRLDRPANNRRSVCSIVSGAGGQRCELFPVAALAMMDHEFSKTRGKSSMERSALISFLQEPTLANTFSRLFSTSHLTSQLASFSHVHLSRIDH